MANDNETERQVPGYGPIPDKPWTAIPRAAMQDPRISLRARGLLAFLLSKPAGWRFDFRSLAREFTEGDHAVRGALRELREAGYIQAQKTQNSAGQWITNQILVPVPSRGNQHSAAECRDPECRKTECRKTETRLTDTYREDEIDKKDLPSVDRARARSAGSRRAEALLTEKIVPIIQGGARFDATHEFARVFREGWTAEVDAGRNPVDFGTHVARAYADLLGVEAPYSMLGRLVATYGIGSIVGLEAAFLRGIGDEQDRDWLRYAFAVCKKTAQEKRGSSV